MTEIEYTQVMLAKLIAALIRKDTEQDGNWGFPSFKEELREMFSSLEELEAVKNNQRILMP